MKRFLVILIGLTVLSTIGLYAFIRSNRMYVDVTPDVVSDYCEVTIISDVNQVLTAEIYDRTGNRVSTLFSGVWPGKGIIPWERFDDLGNYCVAGQYSVVVTYFVNSRYTSTKKTFILK